METEDKLGCWLMHVPLGWLPLLGFIMICFYLGLSELVFQPCYFTFYGLLCRLFVLAMLVQKSVIVKCHIRNENDTHIETKMGF